MKSQRTSASRRANRIKTNARHAFTLVELLVVITIIGILVAFLVPAIATVMGNAKDAQMGVEIAGLAQALEKYQMENLSYPPDFADVAAMDKLQMDTHLARKYRYRTDKGKPNDNLVALNGQLPSHLDPAEALVFWLSGLSGDQKFPLTGRNPANRDSSSGGGARAPGDPYFPFDKARLQDLDGDGFPEYYPEHSEMPYVYLRSDHYLKNAENPSEPHFVVAGPNSTGIPVRAYAADITEGEYAAADKFQIICAGRDNLFMNTATPTVPEYPSGMGYLDEDEDNITNFSEGSTLQAAIP